MAENAEESSPDPAGWLEDYGSHLYAYAMYRVRDSHFAEDLVQDALLSAWKGFAGFQGRSSVKTWLTRILHNRIVDHIRKDSREKLVFSDKDLEIDAGDEYNNAGGINPIYGARPWSMRPDQLASNSDFWKVLLKCVEGLPPAVGKIFVEREVDGLTTEEICEQNEISPNNFWVILHRARKGLRKCLEINWFNNE